MTGRLKPRAVAIAVQIAVVVLVHAVLLRWFADGEVARVLFTGGHSVSLGLVAGSALFFVVRLTLYLVLPGAVLAQVGWLLYDLASGSPRGEAPHTPPS